MSEPVRLYQPSNSTDGDCFTARWCERCRKDSQSRPCGILMRTMIHGIGDKEYPREWRYVDGQPTCTAYQSKDEPRPKSLRHDVIIATRDGNRGQGRFF